MNNQKFGYPSKYRRALDDWMNEQGLTFKDDRTICYAVLSFVQFLEYRELMAASTDLRKL